MKKWFCLLLAGALTFSLAACHRGQNQDILLPESTGNTSATQPDNTNATADTTDATHHTSSNDATEETPSLPVIYTDLVAPFSLILKSEESFYSTNRQASVFLSNYNKNVWRFSVVDMDSDNSHELALMFDDGNILILHQDGTMVFGFEFGLHAMYQINNDGSFLWQRDAGNVYGCSTLKFTGSQYNIVELWRVESNKSGATTYFVNNSSVSKEYFESLVAPSNKESTYWEAWS